jgi:DNA-binding response OmpR family regulator
VVEKILVIDDDPSMLKLIKFVMGPNGYEVITALSGQGGLEKFYKHQPDLVILDIMMPHLDGWEVCHTIRSVSTVPIIMLTALRWHENVVKGLKVGADDYLAKPFHPQELQARVDAILRRTRMSPPSSDALPLYFGNDLVIDPANRQVTVRDEVVDLTPTEYELLFFMAKRVNRILPPHVIFDNVWPYNTNAGLENVKWYIWRLRKKIEVDPSHPCYILTEHGFGYRFAVP